MAKSHNIASNFQSFHEESALEKKNPACRSPLGGGFPVFPVFPVFWRLSPYAQEIPATLYYLPFNINININFSKKTGKTGKTGNKN